MPRQKNSTLHKARDVAFVTFLQEEFDRRKLKNTRYSLRAFALNLGIDQSHLSKVLRLEKKLSEATKRKCLEIIGADQGIKNDLLKTGNKGSASLSPLSEEDLNELSDWRHFAILELFSLKDFKYSHKYIARKFSMPENDVESYITRLLKAGLLQKNGKDIIPGQANNTWASYSRTSDVRRQMQENLLKKSIESLKTVPIELRDHSSVTIAINKKEMPHLKKVLSQMRKKLMTIFQENGDFDEVYQLSISLFPLTSIKTTEE